MRNLLPLFALLLFTAHAGAQAYHDLYICEDASQITLTVPDSNVGNPILGQNIFILGSSWESGPFYHIDSTYVITISILDSTTWHDSDTMFLTNNYNSDTIAYYVVRTTHRPNVCLITVDGSEHNVLLFDSSVLYAGDTLIVLRQGIGGWDPIGALPASSNTVFVDVTSNAAQQSYAYRVTDSRYGCNTAEAASIHLSNSGGNLQWGEYVPSGPNDSIVGYYVARFSGGGTDTIGTVPRVGVAGHTYTFTDLNGQPGDTYRVLATKVGGCDTSGAHKTTGYRDGAIASNSLQLVTGINGTGTRQPSALYPNPTTGYVYLPMATYTLTDMAGEVLYSGLTDRLGLSGLAKGLYLVIGNGRAAKVAKE